MSVARSRRPSATLLIAVAAVLFGGFVASTIMLRVATSSDSGPVCATSAGSFLNTAWFGSMVEMGASEEDNLPFSVAADPATSQFRYGRTSGYIAAIALDSPYRAEEDAQARALGYQIGQWPIVPLSSSVVMEYSGTLEAYQTHLSFQSPGGAHEFLSGLVDSNDQATRVPDSELPRLGDEIVGYLSPGDEQAGVESEIGLDIRFNHTVVQVDLRGGSQMTLEYAMQVANAAAGQLAATCDSQL